MVIKQDIIQFLLKTTNQYDIIFADPPYGLDQKTFEKVVTLVFERGLLEDEGMLIVEHSKYTKMEHLPHFSFQKSYGGSFFSFFEIATSEDEV
jgi:16S rRNA G966 N2-methylase RsmD